MTLTTKESATVVDLLDRLLDKGAAISGDITLSVADIDLVYVGLRTLLSSIATVEPTQEGPPRHGGGPTWFASDAGGGGLVAETEQPAVADAGARAEPSASLSSNSAGVTEPAPGKEESRIAIVPENVEKGLFRLVLTIVELLRQLMERQAVRRMDGGGLTEEEIERLGQAFLALDNMMANLKEQFELDDEELNLDLGPLGKLL